MASGSHRVIYSHVYAGLAHCVWIPVHLNFSWVVHSLILIVSLIGFRITLESHLWSVCTDEGRPTLDVGGTIPQGHGLTAREKVSWEHLDPWWCDACDGCDGHVTAMMVVLCPSSQGFPGQWAPLLNCEPKNSSFFCCCCCLFICLFGFLLLWSLSNGCIAPQRDFLNAKLLCLAYHLSCSSQDWHYWLR